MKINVAGAEIAYEERGTGRPLLLLHGFPFNRQMWKLQLAGLATTCRVITPDLRGFGESSGTLSTLEDLAEDIHALIDHLALPSVILGGFSMGGYVLLRYLARHADRVSAVLLVSTRAEADLPEGRARRYATIERIQKEGPKGYLAEFLRTVVSPQTFESEPDLVAKVRRLMDASRSESLVGALKAMADRPDSSPVLATITVPTWIVAGSDDKIIPVDVARKMQAAIKGAKSVILPGAGHMVNIEQAERFTSTIREFLVGLPKP